MVSEPGTRPAAVVVGPPGAGKTTVGALLAERLGDAVGAQVGARGEAVEVSYVDLREYAVALAEALTTGGLPDPDAAGLTFRQVSGGFLVQTRDNGRITAADLRVVTQRQPSAAELADLLFAWTVAKHVKSNAIVYAKGRATVGIGAQQIGVPLAVGVVDLEDDGAHLVVLG